MLTIAVIGCGQIGSRHLQALASLNESASIYLVDPSSDSIDRAKNIFYGSCNSTVDFTIHDVPMSGIAPKVDVAIIATSSASRKELVVELFRHCEVRHLILEKFLFQEMCDYDEIEELLTENKAKVWVNQWLSSTYAFLRVSQLFEGSDHIKMKVYGGEWGLACNSVHFIDYFDLLARNVELVVADSDLDSEVIDSKRDGYKEFTGQIEIKTKVGESSLILESNAGNTCGDIYIDIQNQNTKCKLVLHSDRLECEITDLDGSVSEETFNVMFQSQVTHTLVQELMLTDKCMLPEYSRSSYHHKLVLPCFYDHLVGCTEWSQPNCPIT